MTEDRRKAWMITGVSSGFGSAIARAALDRGDLVIGTVRHDRDQAAFEAIAPGRSIGMLLDVRDEAAIRAAVAAAETITGGIDILVQNAGYGLIGGVEETSLAEMRAQFEVNVFGAVAVLQAALPAMRARGSGRLLVITSVSGIVGWPGLGVYSGSKFALEGVCETLAQEVEPLGIKLTMIEPGGFKTEFGKGSRLRTERVIADYAATVGVNRGILEDHAGYEPGDPAKAAAVILTVADMPAPPLRLLLGSDALSYARGKLEAQIAEIAAWEAVTTTTDFGALSHDQA
jgi:NAD(P)-dependent dehydrogenase (short-subunit alcohol dehydrogenase family)